MHAFARLRQAAVAAATWRSAGHRPAPDAAAPQHSSLGAHQRTVSQRLEALAACADAVTCAPIFQPTAGARRAVAGQWPREDFPAEETSMTTRRTVLGLSAATAATAMLPGPARAQQWPVKPIRIVIPWTPGSTTDVLGRVVTGPLSAALGQPVIVDNRSGAGGTIGSAAVARADADGYTLLIHSSAHSAAPATFPNAPYNPRNDLIGIANLGVVPNVIVVNPNRGYRTLADMVARGRKTELFFSSAGIGSATHWAAERFLLSAGLKATHVPHKGGPEALNDVVADRVDFYAGGSSSVLPMIMAKKALPLAVTTPVRSRAFPDLPTTVELGFANSDYSFWSGLLAPAKTPAPIVQRLAAEMNKVLADPAVSSALLKLGCEPVSMSQAEFNATIQREMDSVIALVKAASLKFD
jgi:tripartite-type tricarboxylate transporter receptor subunit TctC